MMMMGDERWEMIVERSDKKEIIDHDDKIWEMRNRDDDYDDER